MHSILSPICSRRKQTGAFVRKHSAISYQHSVVVSGGQIIIVSPFVQLSLIFVHPTKLSVRYQHSVVV
ncbi:MAG: hypothetical protein F6K38_16810 [Moorea sp. SIO3B2]|nr:hypothetical protein [Moorena sp. SIO3B2]